MGPIGFPETSVRNYHSTLRKIPKERLFQADICIYREKMTVAVICFFWGGNLPASEFSDDVSELSIRSNFIGVERTPMKMERIESSETSALRA